MNKNIFKWVVLGGLFVVPFIPFFVSSNLFFPYISTKAFTWRVLVEIVFAAWVVLAALVPEYRPKKSIILYSLLAFIAVIGLADLFGEAPIKSFWSNYERMEGFISLLHLGAFFVVIGSVFNENLWKKWWNTNLAASGIMIIYCLFQIGGAIEIHQGGVRVDGTFGNAAYLAVYMLINIFITLLFILRSKKSTMRWLYYILLLGQLMVLYFTATRGAILGLLGGLLLMALLNLRNKEEKLTRKFSIGLLVGLFVLVAGFLAIKSTSFVQNSPVLGRFATISSAQLKTEGRSFVWPIAMEGIKEKPFLGWGQENFNYVFNNHYRPEMFRLEPWFDRAHNIFLDWAIAGGILGLISYLGLYGALLYSIWKKDNTLTHGEKSLFTGLLAAYFFHNLFVFDHLLSYVLFMSILAYIHSHSSIAWGSQKVLPTKNVTTYVMPATAVLLILTLYFVNIKPISANANLINALQALQGKGEDKKLALPNFKAAYSGATLGRPEVTEWIGTSAGSLVGSDLPEAEKASYVEFAKQVVGKQADDYSTDARYQLLAGNVFSQVGDPVSALKYLDRALVLIPGKQQAYYEKGSILLNQKKNAEALVVFKSAYDLAPQNNEAGTLYLVAALYAKDENLIKDLISKLPADSIRQSDAVVKALFDTGRFNDLSILLEQRLIANPSDSQSYINLAIAYVNSGRRKDAIDVLNKLKEIDPTYVKDVDAYIEAINKGQI